MENAGVPEDRSVRSVRKMPAVPAMVGLVIAFYFWTAWSNGNGFSFGGRQADYYNRLTHGFLAGHLYLDAQPDPRLRVEPPNRIVSPGVPYLLDASYFRGRYYLYFGVVPAVALFLPYAALTGQDLPEGVVAALLASGAFVVMVLWLDVLRRRFFPRISAAAWAWTVLAAGLCNGIPVVIRKPEVYEIAVVSGCVCAMASLLGLTLALLRPERAGRWLALAGGAAGLAIGSRPSLAVGAAVAVLGVTAVVWRRQRAVGAGGNAGWRIAAAAGLPLGACLAALGWYNWARFGNPLDVGWRYQLGSNPQGISASLANLKYNLARYYLTAPDRGWFFPFFGPGPEGQAPPGYYGMEQAHGQFLVLPLLAVALALAGWSLVRRRNWFEGAGPVALATAIWSLSCLVPVAMLGVRSNRYQLDFHPPLLVLTLGPILIGAAAPEKGIRWLARAGLGWLAVLSVYNVCISLQTQGFFQTDNPRLYGRLERAANRLAWPLHRLTRPEFGTREYRLVFPAATPGRFEPLLMAGSEGNADALLVHYLADGRGELIFAHQGYGDATGSPFNLHPGQVRRLTVALGTVMPPAGHPWYDGQPAAMGRLRSSVRVALDGAEILTVDAPCHLASPDQIVLGRRRGQMEGEAFFGGRITPARALGPDRAWLARQEAAAGAVSLRLQLPRDRFGMREPLLLTGTREQYDLVCITYVDEHSVQFAVEHRGHADLFLSPVVPVDYLRPHELIIGRGGEVRNDANGLQLWLDGTEVLADQNPVYPAEPWQFYVGCTLWPLNTCRRMFGGPLLAGSRLDASPGRVAAVLGAGRPFSLHLFFPTDRMGMSEPLLTTGVTGRGDGLYVHYVDRNTVVLGFDHWGIGGLVSAPLAVNDRALQQLTISFGPLLAPGDPRRGRLMVALNGIPVFDRPAEFHPANPGEAVVGRNPIGLSTSEPAFQGTILSVDPAVAAEE